MAVTGIIIAGGKSSRMGENKALIKFKGERLIDHAIKIIRPLCNQVIISSNVAIKELNWPIVEDMHKDIGPIGGLHAAINKSKTETNIVIPCDVPNITTAFYEALLLHIQSNDAAIPKHSNGKIEPLIAIYKKLSVPFINQQIAAADYKLMHLVNKLKVHFFQTKEDSLFKNINTPNDLLNA